MKPGWRYVVVPVWRRRHVATVGAQCGCSKPKSVRRTTLERDCLVQCRREPSNYQLAVLLLSTCRQRADTTNDWSSSTFATGMTTKSISSSKMYVVTWWAHRSQISRHCYRSGLRPLLERSEWPLPRDHYASLWQRILVRIPPPGGSAHESHANNGSRKQRSEGVEPRFRGNVMWLPAHCSRFTRSNFARARSNVPSGVCPALRAISRTRQSEKPDEFRIASFTSGALSAGDSVTPNPRLAHSARVLASFASYADPLLSHTEL